MPEQALAAGLSSNGHDLTDPGSLQTSTVSAGEPAYVATTEITATNDTPVIYPRSTAGDPSLESDPIPSLPPENYYAAESELPRDEAADAATSCPPSADIPATSSYDAGLPISLTANPPFVDDSIPPLPPLSPTGDDSEVHKPVTTSAPLPLMGTLQLNMPTTTPPSIPTMGVGQFFRGVPRKAEEDRFRIGRDPDRGFSSGRHKKEVKRRTKTGCLTCRKRRIKVRRKCK